MINNVNRETLITNPPPHYDGQGSPGKCHLSKDGLPRFRGPKDSGLGSSQSILPKVVSGDLVLKSARRDHKGLIPQAMM